MRLQAKEKQTIVDLFIFRFSRLQEVMGAKITSLPIRDILNRLKRYLFFSVPANGFIYAN